MSTPAVLALTKPSAVPAAASVRLVTTGDTLLLLSDSTRAGVYAGWLNKAGRIAKKAADLLALAVAGNATERELAGLLNAERSMKAGAALFAELARRSSSRSRVDAMSWASMMRTVYHDITLTRREFAYGMTLSTNWADVSPTAAIRILPGAEMALTQLERDLLVYGSAWSLEAMADSLTAWVTLS